MQSMLEQAGFVTEIFEDTSQAHLSASAAASAPSPLSLGVFVENIGHKTANARRSLEEGQVRLVRGVFRAG
jgi:hypothetical protein